MRGTIWIVVVVFVVGVVGFGVAASGAYEGAAETRTVDNETHTLSTGDSVTLDAADEWTSLHENETVTHDGSVLDRGTDYTIDYGSGELTAANSTYDGAEVGVDYAYEFTDTRTRSIGQVLSGTIGPLFGLLTLAAAIGALVDWMGLM